MDDQLVIFILLAALLLVLGEEGEGGEVQVDKKKTDLESYMQLHNFQVEGSGEEDVSSDEKWVRVKL